MSRDRYFESECIEIDALCSNVRHITFRRCDGEELTWTPGQFVMIHFEDPEGIEINRSYSMAAASEADATFDLCVKLVEGGQGSGLIHRLSVGDKITTSGPYGRFVLKAEVPSDLVLVATGTGVAPFRAMIPRLEQELEAGKRVWLLFGVRFADEQLYHQEWMALAARFDNFLYRPCVSRPAEGDRWGGVTGYVSGFVDEVAEAVEVEDAIAYLCGVPAMIDDMRKILTEVGFGMRAIKTEKYVSPPPPRKRVKKD